MKELQDHLIPWMVAMKVRSSPTIMEHPLHVEAVGSAGLVVGAPFEVGGQLARAAVVDHARVVLTDAIWGKETREYDNTDGKRIG